MMSDAILLGRESGIGNRELQEPKESLNKPSSQRKLDESELCAR
jgi:hypothetical protein